MARRGWDGLHGHDGPAGLAGERRRAHGRHIRRARRTSVPSAEFRIPESHEDLLDDAVAQEEREFLYAIVQRVSGGTAVDRTFQRPSSGRVTSPYGERRTLQPGSFMSVHEGVDYAAPTGAPIPAPNRGRVAFVGPLTIRGNTVILDHGFGVYTLFYHLHDFSVLLGQVVERGATVGLVGSTDAQPVPTSTGRCTSPAPPSIPSGGPKAR